MNAVVQTINSAGRAFVDFALPMLIQSSVLILILFLVDIVLRRKVRAVFRYWIWMLVLLKLLLPPSLCSPISFGTWLGDTLEAPTVTLKESPGLQESYAPPAWQPQAQLGDGAPGDPLGQPFVYDAPVRSSEATSPPVPVRETPETPVPAVTDRAAPPAVVPAPAPTLDWPGLVLLGWLAVVAALSLLLIQRALFVKDLVAQAETAPTRLLNALNECRTRIGLPNAVALRISPNATSPAVCGLLRPVILIPRTLAPKLQPHDLQAVWLHELAHIKRGDLWINLAQTLLQIIYFYNPLLWLANVKIRRVREQAVDEVVLVAMGESARQYPDTLLSVARLAFKRRPALSLRLIGVVESKNALAGRIKHILNRPIPKSARLGLLSLLAVVITAAVFLPMAKARPMTDRARDVLELAEKEARSHNHAYVGTEHILLALAHDGDAVSARVLANLDVDGDTLRTEMLKLVKPGAGPPPAGNLPRTPRAKRVMQYAREEARALNHDYLGTEHILLGLMREKESIAAQVLGNLGITWQQVRAETLRLLKPGDTTPAGPRTVSENTMQATLPSGVTVELLGACEHPSPGKQWWGPDGLPLTDAPYDRPGAWVTAHEPNTVPFQLALRVRGLPEHWEASVRCLGNSFGGAANPPYKAGKRLHDLRWLMIEVEPNQTTCTIRCDVVEPWQTIARTSPVDLSQQTTENGVAFTEINEGLGSSVSVTVTGPVGDRDDTSLPGGRDLRRVIAITKDGRTEESLFGGLYFHGPKPQRLVATMRNGRMEDVLPARPPADDGIKRATVYFPRLPLADIREFQFQTRALTWVEFSNVPLRPGKGPAVEVRVGSDGKHRTQPDVTFQTRPLKWVKSTNFLHRLLGKGTSIEIHVESDSEQQAPREITLPDVDHEPVMLDLVTGQLVPLPHIEPESRLLQAIAELDKGDIVYDGRALILVRNATSPQAEADPAELVKAIKIAQRLPALVTVTTAEGRRYEIKILSADDQACTFTYSPILADKGAGGGALVDTATEPTPESTQADSQSVVARLPNGVTVEFLAYSGLSLRGGLTWYGPQGKETDLPGVYEADVEGLGTVLAFRVEPPQASLFAEVYRGPDNEQIKKTWRLPESPVRLFALGQERRFANLRFMTSIAMPAVVEIIPLSEDDVGKLIEVNRFGIAKIVDLQIADSLMPEMMMEQMGLPDGLPVDNEMAASMGVHDMVEPPALQFTCINDPDSFPSPVALLDIEGRTYPLELVTRRRGDGTYQARLWPSQLAGLVVEAAPTHNADVHFRNVSLTPNHVTRIRIEPDPEQRIEWVRSDTSYVLEALTNSLRAYRKRLGGRCPDSLWGLQSYHDENAFKWLTANVVYLGDTRRPDDDARVPIAYDKTLLSQGKGTYVVYSDSQLEFTGVPQLKELGIATEAEPPMPSAAVPKPPTRDDHGIFLLEQRQDDDRLYLIDAAGNIRSIFTGLDICETIGGAHMMAVDERRKTLWVTENVGGRLWKFDLTTGQVAGTFDDLKASAVAVDPDTGDAWLAAEPELIRVVSPQGTVLATYEIPGYDIAYSPHDKSFWVTGKEIYQLDRTGKIRARVTGVGWVAVSVSTDRRNGDAWVAVAAHSDLPQSKNELWHLDHRGAPLHRIDLDDHRPFCVRIDPRHDIVWVGCRATTLRFDTNGRKLPSTRGDSAFSIALTGRGDTAYLVDRAATRRTTILESGRVKSQRLLSDLSDVQQSQKWIVPIPFPQANLPSSAEVATSAATSEEASGLALKQLGLALLTYAADNDGQFPSGLRKVMRRMPTSDFQWCLKHSEYVGRRHSTADAPTTMLAYDKTLLTGGKGTNVLFRDGHVEFVTPENLRKLGIAPPTNRTESAEKLEQLGMAVHIYAADHDNRLPPIMDEARAEMSEPDFWWCQEHAEYIGQGKIATRNARQDRLIPVAYDKTLLREGEETNVLFLDLHVEFLAPARLQQLGILPPTGSEITGQALDANASGL